MRNMSFEHTKQQIYNGTKTETTRKGWGFLKPGDRVMAVEKGIGLKKGKKIVRIRQIEIVKNEPIKCKRSCYTDKNIKAEGFPGMAVIDFVDNILIKKCGCKHGEKLNRITFKYVEEQK